MIKRLKAVVATYSATSTSNRNNSTRRLGMYSAALHR